MAALRESLRAHGQRTPIEVTPLVTGRGRAPLRPHLRLAAAHRAAGAPCRDRRGALRHRPGPGPPPGDRRRRLRDHGRGERDPPRAQPLRARPRRRPRHRARRLPQREGGAPRALRHREPRPKRSRIRAFLEIYHALDGTLRFPAALPERLGLRLVEKVRAGQGAAIAAAIARAEPRPPRRPRRPSPLVALLAPRRGRRRSARSLPAPARRRARHGAPGPCPDADGSSGRRRRPSSATAPRRPRRPPAGKDP